MKTNKVILIIGMFLLVLPITNAALNDGLKACYSFQNYTGTNLPDVAGGKWNATRVNTPLLIAGKVGNAMNFTSASSKYLTTTMTSIGRQNTTICMWAYPKTTGSFISLFGSNTATNDAFRVYQYNTNVISFKVDTATADNELTSTKTFTANKWLFICGQWEKGKNQKTYFNQSVTNASATNSDMKTYLAFYIGAHNDNGAASSYFNGFLDELRIYNRSLTSAEITTLWNNSNGVGCAYPAIPSAISNFTITAKEIFNNSAIIIFNASIKNNTKTWNFTTSSGTINTYPFKINQAKPLINITIRSVNHFTKTYKNYNISRSGNIQSNMTQAEIRFGATLKVAGTPVNNPSFFAVGSGQPSGTTLRFRTGKVNVTFFKTNYYNLTQEFTITALQNISANISGVYNRKLNVSPKVGGSTTGISGATINVTWLNYTYSEQQTPSGQSAVFNVINGTYNVSASKPGGYVLTSKIKTLNLLNRYYNLNISLYQWNTFNITVFNELLLTKLPNTTTIISGLSSGYNRTVAMKYGNATISLLVPDIYNFIYKDTRGQFNERFRYVTLENGTYNRVDLYLLNASTGIGETVTVTTVDQISNLLSGYIVVAQKYIPAANQFIIVESEISDNEGVSIFNLVRGNSQYRWLVIKNNEILYQGNVSKINDITKTITVPLGAIEDYLTPTTTAWRLRTSLTNISNQIIFSWVSLSGSGTVCMNVTWTNFTTRKILNSQCSSATSGNLTYTHSETTGTVNAVAYVKGSTYVTNAINLVLGISQELWNLIGKDGLVLYMIFMIIGAAMTITNISTMPWVLGIIHIASWGFGLIPINYGISGIAIIAGLILIMLRLER